MTVILVRRFVRRLLDILLKTPRRWCQAFRPDTIAGFFPVRRKLLTANTCFSSKLLATLIVVLSSTAIAQDRDSARVSIHQSEAEMHRWDNMKVHPSVPQLQRGAELARKGDVIGAVRAFQKAAPARPSMAYFNLGIVYFETGRLEQAIRYFRLSYRARRDSVCLDYLQNTERLINEHKLRR